ncbi:gp085 [Rhodococcus phage ReqiPoco6]|uniref:Gp085 n=1 Tax=Rhodococcus phage ReqiPoco6 TaxID=691964 RepID=D4P7V3_9CAUD|nr:gp085 [Rhodococcus phage ReqiPoco6]ADD81083.1 gp085 [Rhodococcus phage ReqiPoco6]
MTDTLYLKEVFVGDTHQFAWLYATNTMNAESTPFPTEDEMITHVVGVFRDELFDENKLVVEATEEQREKLAVEYQKQFGVVDIPVDPPVEDEVPTVEPT